MGAIGLEPGEKVRFRRRDRARWQVGAAVCLERDGSLRVTDGDGAARAVPLTFVQVRATGPAQWEPLSERSRRGLQMQFDLGGRPRRGRGRTAR